MATAQRAYDRGKVRGDRLRHVFGSEARDARLALGLSQRAVGSAVRMPASKVSRIERGVLPSLAVGDAAVLSSILGLDLTLRAFPGGAPVRDAGHARRMSMLLAHVARPLRYRTEVPLPAREGRPDQRGWDATISDRDETMGLELEMRIYDAQTQTRRVNLKWRDSGLTRMLLVVADTKSNRRALHEFDQYFEAFPRLRTAAVLRLLDAGRLPPTGMIFF